MSAIVPPERFLGCLLGQAVGDALGAPYEGLTHQHIYFTFGPARDLVDNPRVELLRYTDDTQMMIAVAETLVERGEIDEASLCRSFAANFDPDRGYGPGARRILEALIAGEDWRGLAGSIFPGGSLGNGAAMRVAPVGLLFSADRDRVVEQAERSALPTHLHPLGIEGARLMALAVALAARQPVFDRSEFYGALRQYCRDEEYQWQLDVASRLRRHQSVGAVLGNGVEAHRSVVTAIACFAGSPESYEGAVARAIGLGNDTDTLAAMAGALSGAHLGIAGIPPHLLARLEDQDKGRSYLHDLAGRLHARRPASP
jgi:poly(ADP-ribose) glycohydrolase ARH3